MQSCVWSQIWNEDYALLQSEWVSDRVKNKQVHRVLKKLRSEEYHFTYFVILNIVEKAYL